MSTKVSESGDRDRVQRITPTSGVPIYFRVPLMPPVSARPRALKPRSQAVSIKSCIWKTLGMSLPSCSHPVARVPMICEQRFCMLR